jgi:hypothetical protein
MPSLRTLLGWGLVIVLVLSFIANPTAWAHGVDGLLALLKHAGSSLATFFQSL